METTIKCPKCSAIITLKTQSELKGKMIKCPACKEIQMFESYKTTTDNDYHTEVGEFDNFIIGELHVVNARLEPFKLKIGRNVIGRKADSSKADIQLPVNMGKSRISREHIVIDVNKVIGIGYVHSVSLYKEKVNDTYINNEKLLAEDSLILSDGDIIMLPDNMCIKFIIPDSDLTDI